MTTNAFIVGTYLDRYYELNGALQGGRMEAKQTLQLVNNALALATFEDDSHALLTAISS